MKKAFEAVSAILTVMCLLFSGCSAGYRAGSAIVEGKVKTINVDWNAGNVIILGTPDSKISFSETSPDKASSKLEYKLSGSALNIRRSGESSTEGETLRISIPASFEFDEIEVRSESAKVAVKSVRAHRLDVVTDSGDINVSSAEISGVTEAESVSGRIDVTAVTEEFELESESGDIRFCALSSPKEGFTDTKAGETTVLLPKDCSFKATVDRGTGSFESSFNLEEKGYDNFICSGGANSYDFETESGFITVNPIP